ncbi:MAG: hypothetical protein ABSE06_10860 [Anaerolineaceae bacterium]
MTEKQKMKLVQENKSSKQFGIGCGIGSALFLFAIASIFPIVFIPMGLASLHEHDMGGATGSFIAAAVWLLVWGGFGIVAIVWGIQSGTKDRSKVLLKKTVGPINLVGIERTGEHGHTYIDHELHIGQEEFDVDEKVAGFMMQGDLYAAYYIENMDGSGQQVLSVEHLSK